MVIFIIKFAEHVGGYQPVIRLFNQPPARMPGAIQCLQQASLGKEIHFGRIDEELLDIGIQHGIQLFFRESGFLEDRFYYFECFCKIFVQGIQGDIGILGRARQLQPCSIVIQFFRNIGGGVFP